MDENGEDNEDYESEDISNFEEAIDVIGNVYSDDDIEEINDNGRWIELQEGLMMKTHRYRSWNLLAIDGGVISWHHFRDFQYLPFTWTLFSLTHALFSTLIISHARVDAIV